MANLCIKTPSSAILVLIFQLLVLRPRPSVEVTPRLMQAEMAPILNRIAKEGSYNKPAVPNRPRNLTVATSKQDPTSSCPPYSQVDRSKARGSGPGTAPKPQLAARPLATSFLHSMVQTGRLQTVSGAQGAPSQDRGW